MAAPAPDDGVDVIHAENHLFDDLYHQLLQATWPQILGAIAGLFLLTNTAFAVAYWWFGGVANARPGSFADAFFFSVQTLGTIGYGGMLPQSRAAHLLVTLESLSALLVSALSTGLVFAKFSMPRARIAFSNQATIYLLDGQAHLAFRIANQRGNFLVEAQIRVTLIRKERTREGVWLYRMYDLALVRDRSPALGRSWTVLHQVAPGSQLFGQTTESLREQEAELLVTVVGIDGTTAQTLYARHTYDGAADLIFGARHADMLTAAPGGRLTLDFARFHDIEPAPL